MGRWDGGVWNPDVPLPRDIRIPKIQAALIATEQAIDLVNDTFHEHGLSSLFNIAQSNNFSGIVSNVLTNQVERDGAYSGGSERRGPDLFSRKTGDTLEVKTTQSLGKGAEGHNGHGGWHIVGCFMVDRDTGGIRFIHVMVANLVAFNGTADDWYRSAGTLHTGGAKTGHTETYGTTKKGTAKLRDGTVYRDLARVDAKQIRRWRNGRVKLAGELPIPTYSPFYVTLSL